MDRPVGAGRYGIPERSALVSSRGFTRIPAVGNNGGGKLE